MTPLELVTHAASLYSRYDLVDKILQNSFAGFLSAAHSIDLWRRDLRTLYVVSPSIVEGRVAIPLGQDLTRIRVVRNIELYKSYSQNGTVVTPADPIFLCSPYTEAADHVQFNYYGFKESHKYYITGSMLNLTDVDSSCTCVGIEALVFPTYNQHPITGAWQSDSWILDRSPELIEAFVRVFIAGIVADPKLIQAAQMNLQQQRYQFITTYPQESISWQSIH